MAKDLSTHELRKELEQRGFYTGNLWNEEDVTIRYKCTKEQAQEVLDIALNCDSTMGQIWFAIEESARNMELQKK